MSAFPQYAKTTSPDVVIAIRENERGVQAFHERACAFALENGAPKGAHYASSFAGSHRIRAIGGDQRPETGKWKKGYGGYGWLPYKNNPLHEDMEAISFIEEDVPGLPAMLRGPYLPNGSQMIYSPRPFELDGAVYVGFSGTPVEDGSKQPDWEAAGWVEIKASEFHAARELYEEVSK